MTTSRAASFTASSILWFDFGGFAIIAAMLATSSRVSYQWDSASMTRSGLSATLISEVDGSMLPIVGFRDAPTAHPAEKSTAKRPDRRKLRHCHWKEIRVSTVREPGSVDTWYGVALGEPLAVGCMMLEYCKFKGLHEQTHIHAVADGASWIADQCDRQFGTRCKFHVEELGRHPHVQ